MKTENENANQIHSNIFGQQYFLEMFLTSFS